MIVLFVWFDFFEYDVLLCEFVWLCECSDVLDWFDICFVFGVFVSFDEIWLC